MSTNPLIHTLNQVLNQNDPLDPKTWREEEHGSCGDVGRWDGANEVDACDVKASVRNKLCKQHEQGKFIYYSRIELKMSTT